MSRLARNPLVYLLILVVALGVGGAVTLAQGDAKIENKSKVRHSRPFLGVTLQSDRDGVRVIDVVEGSAADEAGLREGDLIVGIEGDEVDEPWELTRRLLEGEPGDRVDVEFIRDDQRQSVTAELGQRNDWSGNFHFDSERFEKQMAELGQQLGNMQFDFEWNGEALEGQMQQLHEKLAELHLSHGSRPRLGVELS